MKDFDSISLRVQDNHLSILDQRKLPDQESWVEVASPFEMAELIQSLAVRGAPLIGVAAAVSLAFYQKSGHSPQEVQKASQTLRASRPTAVNLMNALDRLSEGNLVEEAERILWEDVDLCEKIANNGLSAMPDEGGVLTHCNTGGLATVGRGTALGVISYAVAQGKKLHVYVDETRPLLQGGRLTTWELEKLGIPYTLITDSMAPILMRDGRIQAAIVGADRIAVNGDFANKVGTYGVAVACRAHKIPFYTAAPNTTFDPKAPSGREIPIEERGAAEVQGFDSPNTPVRWAPKTASVFNPSFDVTPAELVTGWITDQGRFDSQTITDANRHS